MSLSIVLNGQARTFDNLTYNSAILDLIFELDVKRDRVAIELNGEIAVRGDWSTILLKNDDRIELVHFVGGGS